MSLSPSVCAHASCEAGRKTLGLICRRRRSRIWRGRCRLCRTTCRRCAWSARGRPGSWRRSSSCSEGLTAPDLRHEFSAVMPQSRHDTSLFSANHRSDPVLSRRYVIRGDVQTRSSSADCPPADPDACRQYSSGADDQETALQLPHADASPPQLTGNLQGVTPPHGQLNAAARKPKVSTSTAACTQPLGCVLEIATQHIAERQEPLRMLEAADGQAAA